MKALLPRSWSCSAGLYFHSKPGEKPFKELWEKGNKRRVLSCVCQEGYRVEIWPSSLTLLRDWLTRMQRGVKFGRQKVPVRLHRQNNKQKSKYDAPLYTIRLGELVNKNREKKSRAVYGANCFCWCPVNRMSLMRPYLMVEVIKLK